MILIFDFDQDSGFTNIHGQQLNSSVYGYYWCIVEEHNRDNFIEAWYHIKFGVSDRVYETLEPVFENVVYCLMNDIEDKIESGNYSVHLVNNMDFYYLFKKFKD